MVFGILPFSSAFAQFKIPEKPKFQTSVYDYAKLLSPSQKTALENKLIKYSDTTSTQIVVAVIKSTKGEEIGYLATNWAHKWGIGQKKEDNGVFILLAKNDRRVTIRTGYGTEHLLTDYTSRQIIEREIIPFFKADDYYGGLNAGTDAVFKVLKGEYKGKKKEEFPIGIIFIIILIILFIFSSRGNKGGGSKHYRGNRSGDIFDPIILSNSGRGGFSGGGFFGGGSSGGFGGGFGGGGFGGGGASGSW